MHRGALEQIPAAAPDRNREQVWDRQGVAVVLSGGRTAELHPGQVADTVVAVRDRLALRAEHESDTALRVAQEADGVAVGGLDAVIAEEQMLARGRDLLGDLALLADPVDRAVRGGQSVG